MGYLTFRGVSTESLTNVYVSQMPSHKKASMRNTEYYVKGRDGALHVNEGLANFELEVRLVLVNASASARQLVNAWADGTGKLVSSDDLTKAYKATVQEEIQWERVKANSGYYDTAQIYFYCEPYMYESVDSTQTITQTTKLTNPGSATALPKIVVNGSGNADFVVNGYHIYIDGMTSGVPVTIDCENGYVYTASGASSIRGDFPVLDIEPASGAGSVNVVTLGSNVSSIVITPHWRWI